MTGRGRTGLVFLGALVMLALAGVMLAAYFTVLQVELNAGERAAGRVQALYLAEAGLAAAHEALAQDWRRLSAGPLRLEETITVPTEDGPRLVGAYEVVATPLSATAARLVATGRIRPRAPASGGPESGIARSLVAVVVARIRPSFSRLGRFGTLEASIDYGEDGLPWVVSFSGRLEPEAGSTLAPTLVSSAPTESTGIDLAASFHDVDGDGDDDLLLAPLAEPSDGRARTFLEARVLAPGEQPPRAMTTRAVDLLGTGSPIPVITSGWLMMPDGWLTRSGPGIDLFVNTPTLDGTSLVSWSEVRPEQATTWLPPAPRPSGLFSDRFTAEVAQ